MLQSDHYELLDKLRFGKSSDERKEALKALINFEYEARFDAADYLKLLADEDPVFQVYAIGAIGRQKVSTAISELKRIYANSLDTMILNELLTAFQQFESNDFLDIVVEKLKKLSKKPWLFLNRSQSSGTGSDKAFILNQILIPSLKYIQTAGNATVEKTVRQFLDHEDPNVRWHALRVFDNRDIALKQETVSRMKEMDSSPLVRELAAILIEKRGSDAVTS